MKSFKSYIKETQRLQEGVNDPAIFKAVFLAGGPGSGKSFIVGKTALTALGFKVINSDIAFETALRKAGLKPTPEDIYSPKGQEVRGRAKALTKKKMKLAIDGRLGLVIDGTGKNYAKITNQAEMLRDLGYEVAMIFVNTDLDTAIKRNQKRERSLPDTEVKKMWNDVQKNLGKFQNFFRQRMFIVDNSEGSNYEGAVLSTYKRISQWAKTKPASPAAKQWIKTQQNLNEQKSCDLIGMDQIRAFEKFVDRMFEKYGIDFKFTKHFGDRMGDDRNDPCIKMKELADFIKKIYQRQGKSLKGVAGAEAVIKDMQSDLNIPVAVEYDSKNDEFDVVMKTIMRKKNFRTPNKVIKYD